MSSSVFDRMFNASMTGHAVSLLAVEWSELIGQDRPRRGLARRGVLVESQVRFLSIPSQNYVLFRVLTWF
ncbi:hypothetical protein PGT21_005061 [Puccinia graminis f. sp. tritici]|uniref:Uncharacterized protein n=1 Tax=Puccinia graminis f. sp. tritici TaxID=56615 RepID=A0A5B0QMD8_PUCGR|nr:hypothetical protein PGT21_005061 [Puccinia graminis f. sp. tritici]